MHGPIETNAWISVARGCGFAALAASCGMVSLAFDPPAALKFGGYSALLTCAVLILKAWRASNVRYSKTETWIMLHPHEQPPKAYAQAVISGARRNMLYRFARLNALIAAGLLVLAFVLQAWRASGNA